jgi:hypothetical protein
MGGDGMVGELSGVPKAVLQTVFGKALGRRIWQRARRQPGAQIADLEIVGGMLEYVSQRAGETLGEHARQARAIGLRIVYADGDSRFDRMRLARPTNHGPEIGAAAMELFRQSGGRNVRAESVELTVTSVETEAVRRRADGAAAMVLFRQPEGRNVGVESVELTVTRVETRPSVGVRMGWIMRWLGAR